MRLDITNLTMPEPEAVALLKSEVRRLRAALAALADQDATLAICNGNVTVTMDATLTAEERAAIKSCIADDEAATAYERADTLRALLKKLGSDRHIGG